MTYAQQIKHPMWQKKRLEVLEYQGFECQNCGTTKDQLHVHHPFYRRGAMIWEYERHELQTLCNKCHKDAHALDEKIRQLINDPNVYKEQVLGVLKAMALNPYTKLDSHEEIIGFLSYLGLFNKANEDILCGIGGMVGGIDLSLIGLCRESADA